MVDVRPLSPRAQRTVTDIRRAALALAAEHAIDEISVDDIAAAANVSRRTFFNYFSTKNEAFLPDLRIPDDILERFASGGERDLFDAIYTFVCARADSICASEFTPDDIAVIHAILSDPVLRPAVVERQEHVTADIRRAAARRLDVDENDPRAYGLTALVIAFEQLAMKMGHSGEARTMRAAIEAAAAALRPFIVSTVKEGK